jgi:hypothetical protein
MQDPRRRQVANSATVIYPLRTRFCRYSQVTSDAGHLDPTMRCKMEGGTIPCKLNHYLLSFKICLSISFFLFSSREGGGGTEGYCMRGCRLCRGDRPLYSPMV